MKKTILILFSVLFLNQQVLAVTLFEALTEAYKNNTDLNAERENISISEEDLITLKETIKAFAFDILGLENSAKKETGNDKLSGAVEVLIKLRQEARANKDFATSDAIRDRLQEAGIQLKDGKDGTSFSLKNPNS